MVRQHLIDDCRIPEDHIAVATGNQRELDGVNLFDPACKIEHVITIDALKEGWDCSFAYVFCSLASIRSHGAVEQLLGRVLRMPFATRRSSEELNRAYAHVSEKNFFEAAEGLRDRLVDMGFDEQTALAAIVEQPAEFDYTQPTMACSRSIRSCRCLRSPSGRTSPAGRRQWWRPPASSKTGAEAWQ